MNPMTQPDHHPEADLLNAFTEHALPDPERAQILAHMAGCPRCREVVYLAQAAAKPEPAPAAMNPAPQRRWFSATVARWRIALIPAAALAATGAVVLWVQMRPAPAPTQMAKMTEPQPAPGSSDAAKVAPQLAARPAMPADAASPKPAAVVPPRPSAASNTPRIEPPAQPGQTRPGQKKAMLPAPGAIDRNSSGLTAASAAPALSAPAGQKRALGEIHLDARSASMARYAPGPELPIPPAALSRTIPTGAGNAPASPAPPPPNIVAISPSSPPSTGPQALSAEATAGMELAPQQVNGFAVMRLAKHKKLPSGLSPVSAATLLNRLLAVDSAGSVFLSPDAGKHWETVTAQWSGKAIQVQAPPQDLYRIRAAGAPVETASEEAPAPDANAKSVSAQPALPAPSPPPPAADSTPVTAKAKAAPSIPAMLFRLVTDHHQTWVSVDGKLWHLQ
jgi:hypothetical protein